MATKQAVSADLQQVLDADGDIVGGIAYVDHKEVGRWANGEFYLDPGHEDLMAEHKMRVKRNRDQVLENARLAAEAAKPVPKVGTETTISVDDPAPITIAEAATKQNSIPGTGPRNPVRADGDNNRTPEVTKDLTPVSAEDVLRALDNPEGAAAAAQSGKAVGKTK